MISAGRITRASGNQFIIARMRSSFVFATMFPRFATGAAKHCLFPASLATQGNITRNNVSAPMFPSLAMGWIPGVPGVP